MATQFADFGKSASGLLKDSFPFDPKSLAPRNVVTLKAGAKASDSVTSVNASFEQVNSSTSEAKVEINTQHQASGVSLKESFSTKDSTVSVTASVANKGIDGSKISVEGKISRSDSLVLTPTFELANPNFALKVKSSLPVSSVAVLSSGWNAEGALTIARPQFQIGGQVKLTAEKAGLLDSYAATLAGNLGDSQLTLGVSRDKALNVTASYFQKFAADCNGRLAVDVKYPIGDANDTNAPSSVRTALLWNHNAQTTLGVYADSKLSLGFSTNVKLDSQVTLSASVYAPLGHFTSTSSSEERFYGFGVDFSA